jgi:hypothetical protein
MCFFAFFLGTLASEEPHKTLPDFAVATIAKSGSHLVFKTLNLLAGYYPFYCENNLDQPQENEYYFTHFPLNEFQKDLFSQKKVIVLIRDLRDVAISFAHHLCDHVWPGITDKTWKEWYCALSEKEKLTYILTNEKTAEFFSKEFEDAVCWNSKNNVLVIRYEFLVGFEGGGTAESQKNELLKICEFLSIPKGEEDIKTIALLLYGDTINLYNATFRKGKINAWKDLFDADLGAIFKMKYGLYLSDLGYE